jgi:hypothetical protein
VLYLDNYAKTSKEVLNISKTQSKDGNKYIIPKMKLGFTLTEDNLKKQS